MTNISVTGILREYKTFSRDFWLQYKALEAVMPEAEWNNVKMILLRTKRVGPDILAKVDIEAYEMKKAEIDADWILKSEEAKQEGITVHDMIRNDLVVDFQFAKQRYELEGELSVPDAFLAALSGLFPEHKMEIQLDEETTLIGIADMIYIKDGTINIIDWKTAEEGIKFKSRYDMANKQSKKLAYPLSKFEDANGVMYLLQLSLYMWMARKLRPDLQPGKLKIVHIKDMKIKRTYEVEYLEKDIDKLIKWHLKNMKLKAKTLECREIEY